MIGDDAAGPPGLDARERSIGGHVHGGTGRITKFVTGTPLPCDPPDRVLFANIQDLGIRAIVVFSVAALTHTGELADDKGDIGGNHRLHGILQLLAGIGVIVPPQMQGK